jgi:hypothetical protein
LAVLVALMALVAGLGSDAGAAGAASRPSVAADAPAATVALGPVAPISVQILEAKRLLAEQIAAKPILRGVTVEFGATPRDFQAVAYYEVGRIVISPDHTADLSRIVPHECAHIVDWRTDGRIDDNDLPH